MTQNEIYWQVIQEVTLISEGGASFSSEEMHDALIKEIREEYPECTVKVYYRYKIVEHCSLNYEKFLREQYEKYNDNDSDEDEEELLFRPKGDC